MEVGAKLVGIVKTNTKGFCKETTEKLTKYWSQGYYLVLGSNTIVTGGRPLIAIGYTYNSHKVLYFIVIDNTGNKQKVITYLSKDREIGRASYR